MKLKRLSHIYSKKGITIGAIVTGVVIIGVTFGVSNHVGFKPHKNDNLKFVKNEVSFQEEDNAPKDEDGKDDSKENRDLSEHNQNRTENSDTDRLNDTNLLEDARRIQNMNNINLDALNYGTDNGGIPIRTGISESQGNTAVTDGSSENGTNSEQQKTTRDVGKDTGEHDDNRPQGGGGTDDSGGGETPEPEPQPQPQPQPQPETDPDIKPETHPALQELLHYEEIPQNGIDEVPEDTKISLIVNAGNSYTTQYMKFYSGEKLEDWKILYGYDVQLCVGREVYIFTDETNKNLKIEGYPTVAEDDFEVIFSVRLNENSEWIQSEPQKVHVYDQKIVYKDQNGKELEAEYAEQGQILDLYQKYDNYLRDELDESRNEYLFTGWAETKNGKDIGEYYTADKGWKALYLRPFSAVPDGMTMGVESEYTRNQENNIEYLEYIQALYHVDDKTEIEIPYGVHKVSAREEIGDDGESIIHPITFQTDVLHIPRTVRSLDLSHTVVREKYVLDSESKHYVVNEDGLLLNAAKDTLIGVPQNLDTIVVPDTVTTIQCSFGMEKEQKVIIRSEQVPEFNFNEQVHNAKIYVPDEYYYDYSSVWHPNENTQLHLCTEDKNIAKGVFVDSDGAIMRKLEDGRIVLHKIPDNGKQYYVISDKVSIISQDVLEKTGDIEELFIPASVREIEDDAIDMDKVSAIQFMGDMPQMSKDALYGTTIPVIRAMQGGSENFTAKWSEVFGDTISEIEYVNDYILRTEENFIYGVFVDAGEKKAALFEAPVWIESFVETDHYIPEDLELIYVGEHAFDQCVNLKVVELPEETVLISKEAFSGCVNLEGFLSKATQPVFVGENIFGDCGNMRFVAFNSDKVEFENPDDRFIGYNMYYGGIDIGIYTLYLPNTAEDYIDDANCFASGYELVDAGDTGKMLICEVDGQHIVISATSNTQGTVVLPDNTVQICNLAFSGLNNPFTIDSDSFSSVAVISTNSFFAARGFEGNTDERGVLYLSENIYMLEENSFTACSGITKVIIGINTAIDEEMSICIPDNCFLDCIHLTDVVFEESSNIQFIGMNSFAGTAITYFKVPETVKDIGFTPFSIMTRYVDLEGENFPNLPDGLMESPFQFRYDTGAISDENQSEYITILFHGKTAAEEPELTQNLIEKWKYSMFGFNNFMGEYESQQEEMFEEIYWMNYEKYCDENYDITEENDELLREETQQIMDEHVAQAVELLKERLGIAEDSHAIQE